MNVGRERESPADQSIVACVNPNGSPLQYRQVVIMIPFMQYAATVKVVTATTDATYTIAGQLGSPDQRDI